MDRIQSDLNVLRKDIGENMEHDKELLKGVVVVVKGSNDLYWAKKEINNI